MEHLKRQKPPICPLGKLTAEGMTMKKKEGASYFFNLMSIPKRSAFRSATACIFAISVSFGFGLKRWRNLRCSLRYTSTGFLTTYFTRVTFPSSIS